MTALAGFWGSASPSAKLRCGRMLDAQSIYGSSRPWTWGSGALAIGKRLEALLPEDVNDRGPMLSSDGSYMLAADVRIDNRAELGDALDLAPADAARLCDSALLLKSWETWGEAALQRVVGDFALALWDIREDRLVLARDCLGQRPLCFARPDGNFAFASMPRGLHALAELPYALDRSAIADFLAFIPDPSPRTFFEAIERVLPGEIVTVTRQDFERRLWWQPDLSPLRLANAQAYADAVGRTLAQSVAAQLRGAGGAVAAHLSAGLDSSAVVAMAARQLPPGGRVTAFTAVPSTVVEERAGSPHIADEGPLAACTAAMYGNVDHVRVQAGATTGLAELDRSFFLHQRPVPNLCNHGWSTAIHDAAKRRGLRVLLTGQMGNLTFSHSGAELLPQLLADGRLLRLAREWRKARRQGRDGRRMAVQTFGPFVPSRLWKALQRWRGRPVDLADFSLLRPGLAEPAGQVDYAEQPTLFDAAPRLAALRAMDLGNFNKGILGGWGIDTRDPTADRRLVELCLRIPADQFAVGGMPRGLARRVLAGLLPDAVLNERRRGSQGADWQQMLQESRGVATEEAARMAGSAATAMIDTERLARLIDEEPNGRWDDEEAGRIYRSALLRAMSAGHFMRKVDGSNS